MIWFPGTSVTKGAISIPARAAKPEPEPEMVEVVEVIYLGEGWAEWVFTHEVGDQPSLDISDYWGLQLRTPDQGWISPVSFDEIADNVAYMIYDVHEKPDAARVVAHPEGGFFAIPFVNGLQLKVDVPCTFIDSSPAEPDLIVSAVADVGGNMALWIFSENVTVQEGLPGGADGLQINGQNPENYARDGTNSISCEYAFSVLGETWQVTGNPACLGGLTLQIGQSGIVTALSP